MVAEVPAAFVVQFATPSLMLVPVQSPVAVVVFVAPAVAPLISQ